MIRRFVEVIFGNGLVETTPFCADAKVADGSDKTVFGVSMKNLTDADCVGDLKLIFNSPRDVEFLVRKINEALEMYKQEMDKNKEEKTK